MVTYLNDVFSVLQIDWLSTDVKNGRVLFRVCKKKIPMLNLVYISVNFQATGSVQISLDFSFKYNSNGFHYFTIIASKVIKANVIKAGNSK